jgi:hypothetical protein
MKKYLSIKAPPGKGNITLEEAIDAARRVLANGTHARRDAKASVKKSSKVNSKKLSGSASTPISQRIPRSSK